MHDKTQLSTSQSIHLKFYWAASICQTLKTSLQSFSPSIPSPFCFVIISSPLSFFPFVPGIRAQEKENIYSSFCHPSVIVGWRGTNHNSLLYEPDQAAVTESPDSVAWTEVYSPTILKAEGPQVRDWQGWFLARIPHRQPPSHCVLTWPFTRSLHRRHLFLSL